MAACLIYFTRSYLSSLLSTWKVRSMTVVHCRQRMTNVLGRGLSVFINWHSVKNTIKTDVYRKLLKIFKVVLESRKQWLSKKGHCSELCFTIWRTDLPLRSCWVVVKSGRLDQASPCNRWRNRHSSGWNTWASMFWYIHLDEKKRCNFEYIHSIGTSLTFTDEPFGLIWLTSRVNNSRCWSNWAKGFPFITLVVPSLSFTVNYQHDNTLNDLKVLTSFVEPAFSDYIYFIHGERCVSVRVRNRRSGRGTVDFSLEARLSLSQLSNLNSTCWMKQAVQRK